MRIVNAQEFNELKTKGKVVVDFYADWCGPCKMLGPVLEEISKENPDITFVKINCDEEEELAYEFKVMSIPNVFFLNDGKVVGNFLGSQPKNAIERMLKEAYK